MIFGRHFIKTEWSEAVKTDQCLLWDMMASINPLVWHIAIVGAVVKGLHDLALDWIQPWVIPETSQFPEFMPSPSKKQGITQDLPPIPSAASTAHICLL